NRVKFLQIGCKAAVRANDFVIEEHSPALLTIHVDLYLF
ncbi:MAG: hypothetical protein RLZZ472_969, partial [Pseudomonadota bacterium]